MLGDKIGEIKATSITNVLPAEGDNPRFETVAEGSGTFLGVNITFMATYYAVMSEDGTLYGECPNQGVLMSEEGPVTFRANGSGRFTADGGATFRGSAFFRTAVASLARLNGMCLVHERDVDADGNATWNLWEWK